MNEILHSSSDPFLRIADVEHQVGLKRSTIYAMIDEGTFPKPIRLGKRASGWLLSEVNEWKQRCIDSTRRPNSVGAQK